MLPLAPAILSFLVKNGLGSVANAVAQEGFDWLKDKTGIDLSTATEESKLSEDNLLKLKQFQLENEDKLRQYDLEKDKIEQQYFQQEVADRQSARERDTAIVKAGQVNYTSGVLIAICVLFLGIGFYFTVSAGDLNEWAKGSITLLLGRFLGYLDNIYAFEYGTTRNNRSKDETIKNLSKG